VRVVRYGAPESANPGWRQATLQHLLTRTAGVLLPAEKHPASVNRRMWAPRLLGAGAVAAAATGLRRRTGPDGIHR
jgi:hypothetical protein